MGQGNFRILWDASTKNTTGITNTRFCMLSTMVFFIDASQLVLERPETILAHDRNLNPLSKETKVQPGEHAGINFDAGI
jgi:hypothetical protein